LLGIPLLGEHDYFGYCAGSWWTFELITRLCECEGVMEMTAFEKLATLEDIFIW